MCDQQRLRLACAYAQSDQSHCLSLEYSMSVKLLTERHLEFLYLLGGCTGWYESALVKMPHCWKSHVAAQMNFKNKKITLITPVMNELVSFPATLLLHISFSLALKGPLLSLKSLMGLDLFVVPQVLRPNPAPSLEPARQVLTPYGTNWLQWVQHQRVNCHINLELCRKNSEVFLWYCLSLNLDWDPYLFLDAEKEHEKKHFTYKSTGNIK